ncbi:4'-phosphopantetheinyl transferase family protein, partial [Staphylococcus lugdunensis]|uniref:4'-phosphopantetheinyl transferase family protein n=1 Tax=Staphylococcus lugdunensis TaxID=28035 RepID=UPI001F586DF3
MLMIYIYENKKSVFSTIETKLLNFIQEEDLNKIAALYYDRDKLNLLYSRLVVLYGMYKLRGISPNDVNILKEKYGKPYIENNNIYFNISHSGKVVYVAFYEHGEVGIDVEELNDVPNEIIEYCFHEEEKKLMKRAKKREYKRRFYDIWTKKEAYLKKKGTGISDNLKKVNVTKKYDFITVEW